MFINFKNRNGAVQIIISYCILWIPYILKKFTGNLSKDIFFICILLSVLVMVDGKMKYNTKFVKLNFWVMILLLIIMLGFHIL